jgi:RimJ/RimL family protein N-acetyltransferase
VAPDLATLDAALNGDDALAAVLGCAVAPGWCGFADALRAARDAVAADAASAIWGTRLFVTGDPPVLVGWGGFKGPPQDGAVEIGYEIAPGERGRGLATAAAAALVAEARNAAQVTAVTAHTLPERSASVRVLERLGFTRDGESFDGEAGPVWRHRLDVRPDRAT